MSESTDMVTEVYGHILDEDRRKNAELMENAFYNKENFNPQMKIRMKAAVQLLYWMEWMWSC